MIPESIEEINSNALRYNPYAQAAYERHLAEQNNVPIMPNLITEPGLQNVSLEFIPFGMLSKIANKPLMKASRAKKAQDKLIKLDQNPKIHKINDKMNEANNYDKWGDVPIKHQLSKDEVLQLGKHNTERNKLFKELLENQ
jgi:hypothetical protein